ncbi:unnamed protein product [Trifolium pratense]|uniref:Uncharacterized protein n=1 Tax=Trifolium pratense TaxID=57577 RepID=A0ACB0JXZ1_TRIPR|nr:unnamed protein product [Trifolium pratense]
MEDVWTMKKQLPDFMGIDPVGWINAAERFFEKNEVPSRDKLQWAFMSMEDKEAMLWFISWNEEHVDADWKSFSRAMIGRFGTQMKQPLEGLILENSKAEKDLSKTMGMMEEQSVKMTAATADDGEATVRTKMVREEKEANRENKMKSETGLIFESSPPQKLLDVSSPVGYCWERIPPQPKPPDPPNLLEPPDTDSDLTLQPADTSLPPSTVLSRRGPPPEPPDISPPQSPVTNIFMIGEDSISDESRDVHVAEGRKDLEKLRVNWVMCESGHILTLLDQNHNNSSKWGKGNRKWAGAQLLKQAQNKVCFLNNPCVQKIHVHRFFSFNRTRVITRWKPNGKQQTECPVLRSFLVCASPLLQQFPNMYFSLRGISVSAAYLMQTPTLIRSSPLQFSQVHPRSSRQALVVCVLIWVAKEKEESCSYSSFGIEILTKGLVVGEGWLPKSTFINGYAQQERYVEVFKYFKKIQYADSHMLFGENVTHGYVRWICVIRDGTTIITVGGDLMSLKLREAFFGHVFWFMMLPRCLIGMYCNCDSLIGVRKLFEGLNVIGTISWKSLISNYVGCENFYSSETNLSS